MRRAAWVATALLMAPAGAHAQGGSPDIVVFVPGADGGSADAATAALVPDPATPRGPVDAGVRDAATEPSDAGARPAAQPTPEPEEPPLPPEHQPRITLSLEPRGPIALGDRLTLEMRVVVPEGDDVTVPPQSLSPFEIRRRHVRTERTADGKTAFVFTLEVLGFALGEHSLGPVRLRIVTSSGLVGSAETEARTVTIRSLLGNEPNAEPKPATRPVPLMEENPTPKYLAYALLAMLAGGLLALLLRRWWNRRPKPVPPPPPPRPPWEVAIERLDALRHDRHAMLEESRIEAWTDAVSDTIRSYLGARYGFDGLDMTTDEILARIGAMRVTTLAVGELSVFLGGCDLVKFAKASVTAEQADDLLAQAYRIVRATTPATMTVAPGGPT